MPPRLTGLTAGGDVAPWAALGFAVTDGAIDVGDVRLSFDPGAPPGLGGWSWDTVAAPALDGVPTAAAPPPAGPMPAHRNGAVALDHVVLATPDLDRTRAALEGAGLDFRRERATAKLRQAFYVAGPLLVEVAGPATAPDGVGPARLWGLTAVVEDLEALRAVLGGELGEARDAVQPGRRIAAVRREAGHGVPLAFMTPRAPA